MSLGFERSDKCHVSFSLLVLGKVEASRMVDPSTREDLFFDADSQGMFNHVL